MSSIEYKGFTIFTTEALTLKSGQNLYKIRELTNDVVDEFGRIKQTTVEESKRIIDKYLGAVYEPHVSVNEMSQELFDQLQAGTVAGWDLEILQKQYDDAVAKMPAIFETVGGLETLKDTIASDVAATSDMLASTQEQVLALTSQINQMTADLKAETENIYDVEEVVGGITDKIADTVAGYEAAIKTLNEKLAAAQGENWLKNIPLLAGAGVAVIVGLKFLEALD